MTYFLRCQISAVLCHISVIIQSLLCKKLLMCATLCDPAILQINDLICVADPLKCGVQ